MAWFGDGKARPGKVGQGKVGHGKVWFGWASKGTAGSGTTWSGWVRVFQRGGMMGKNELKNLTQPTNGGKAVIATGEPYTVMVTIQGTADMLFHRWNCEAVEAKGKAAKNSVAKKTDDIESYVYRNESGELCLPGEYLRQSVIHAAKFRQDPRSPRKSAMDLYKAGVVSLTNLAGLGVDKWDYEDRRRVVIQRSGVNRVRPAMRVGWKAAFQIMVTLPEYIAPSDLNDVIQAAGRLIGVGDFRPTFGRFQVIGYTA